MTPAATGPGTRVPRRLRPGDTVAVISPAMPAIGLWPHRARQGIAYLESLGLRVKLMPNAAAVATGLDSQWAFTAGSPAQRVDDIHAAFADPEVAAVIAAIGGDACNQLLPLLDYDLIAAHPKIFQGISDVTQLHWAFLKHAGLRTLYGPALTTNLAERPEVFPLTAESLRAAWFGGRPYALRPAEGWTDEFQDFSTEADRSGPRALRPGEGWTVLRPGVAEGWLLGGCLEVIHWHLKGSSSWIDPDGAILFLETGEFPYAPVDWMPRGLPPAAFHSMLVDLENLGFFARARGLVFARPYGYRPEETALLWEVVRARTTSHSSAVSSGR
jgi:muramoyltetrapeptide carboxypeptidase LdcA involved in peptidoglycan recycling